MRLSMHGFTSCMCRNGTSNNKKVEEDDECNTRENCCNKELKQKAECLLTKVQETESKLEKAVAELVTTKEKKVKLVELVAEKDNTATQLKKTVEELHAQKDKWECSERIKMEKIDKISAGLVGCVQFADTRFIDSRFVDYLCTSIAYSQPNSLWGFWGRSPQF